MQFLKNTYANLTLRYGKRRVFFAVALIVALLIAVVLKLTGGTEPVASTVTSERAVSLASVSSLMGNSGTIEALGTAEAVREARLETEASGRVTSVPVKLGAQVGAGAVIATIENSRERATVLQAQGVYEAAKASASVSDVGSASADRAYKEAVTQATNAYRGAFASADNVLRNTVDQVFSQPDSKFPGLKIDGQGQAIEIGKERVALEALFDAWALKTNTELTLNGEALLIEAEANVTRLATFVTTLTSLLSEEKALSTEERDRLISLRNDFAAARSTVNGTLQTLSGARSALSAAKSAQDQAKIASSRGDVSLAEAQVKQALGALRLAQANLEKTIVRSPISGTLNSLSLKEGTTVGQGMPAAIVSSTGGLEIVAYVNESEARLITIGADVTLQSDETGTVTQIASAIDSVTKKVEVRIGVSGETKLTNGEAVRVSIQTEVAPTDTSEIRLPVVAIKMTPEGPIVFSVDENRTLVPHTVTLGAIVGDSVVVEDGVTPDLSIVTDARGLRAGEVVTVN